MKINRPNKEFIISADTLLLKATRHENRIKTLIIEGDKKVVLPKKPLHVIRSSCRHYGTSLEVVTHGAKKVLSDRHKVPIVLGVDRGFPLILLPTLSPMSDHNMWIALHAIVSFKSRKAGFTHITLSNDFSILAPVSETIIQRQISLAYLLQVNYHRKFVKFYGTLIHRPPTFI